MLGFIHPEDVFIAGQKRTSRAARAGHRPAAGRYGVFRRPGSSAAVPRAERFGSTAAKSVELEIGDEVQVSREGWSSGPRAKSGTVKNDK